MSKSKILKSGLTLCQITLASCFMICLPVLAAPTTIGGDCHIVLDLGAFFWPEETPGGSQPGLSILASNTETILTGRDFDGDSASFANRKSCYFRTEAELTNPDSTCDVTTPEITATPETAYVALINYSSLKYCAYKYEVDFAAADRRFSGAVVSSLPPAVRAPILAFEEPIDGGSSNGIANVRGWLVSDTPVTHVDLHINGAFFGNIPYGGSRGDIGVAYPTYPNSTNSGFSMAFGFSGLTRGAHTMTLKAYDAEGLIAEQTNSFFVTPFDSAFIGPLAPIDLSDTNFISPAPGDSTTLLKRFRINNAVLDGVSYDLLFEWNSATQSFEIIDAF